MTHLLLEIGWKILSCLRLGFSLCSNWRTPTKNPFFFRNLKKNYKLTTVLTNITHSNKSISTIVFRNPYKEHLQSKESIREVLQRRTQNSQINITHCSLKTRPIYLGAAAQQLQGSTLQGNNKKTKWLEKNIHRWTILPFWADRTILRAYNRKEGRLRER